MAVVSKLSEIVLCVYREIEILAPVYVETIPFVRWSGPVPLVSASPEECMRNFRVGVPALSRGSKPDQSAKLSRKATLQVQLLYPEVYQMEGDLEFLGIEVLRPDDSRLIENVLCHRRPMALNDIQSVDAPQWVNSYLLTPVLWVINMTIEYMESNT